MSSFAGLVFLSITATAEPEKKIEVANNKAENYHKLLLKRPGNPTVFGRFVNAWLDTGDKKGLRAWLEERAKTESVSDLRILSDFHEYLGEDQLALSTLTKAVDKDPKNAELRLVRAKMLARALSFDEALKDLALAAKDDKVGVDASKLQGIYYARSGQIEKAVAIWKDVIARFPKDEELREDLIELEVVEGLYDDAAKASAALIAMTKDPYLKVLRQMRLADIEILGGKREEGLATYQKILDATGEGTWIEREVLARLEKVYLREDNVKGLRDLYQEIREKYPRRISIQKALAHQMAATGEMDEAIALFREVLKITPGNLANRQEFMGFLEKNGKWAEAKTELNDLLKVRKNDVLLWQRLAQLEQLLENQPGVKKALDQVRDLKKSTPEGVVVAANLYDQSDLKAEAEALLREGMKLFVDSDEVKEALASFLIQNKKEKEALTIWREMAKDAPREVLLRVARSLSSHGKTSEAYSLIYARVAEFKNDVLILAKLCSLVTNEKEAAQALPHALELVKRAATPTDMETYMRLAVQVIKAAEKEQEISKNLEAKETLTVAECCLLAELFSNKGDTIGAARYLKKAEENDQGLLAKFYRVHYNEQRGELDSAVSIMESIITSPEGRKTVYMRRLVALLQRDGKLDDALARVDEWKRMAPGDRAAWQKKADILSMLGRPDESVTELRRMIGKFGSEESLRASLAAGLLEVGDYRPAQKIFEQLYDESDSQRGKLKWVEELAKLAQQEGSVEQLLENFDRRARSNPQSIEPLLAKAEIYRVLNKYDQRREMLGEAARRRPHDVGLLIAISEVEERAGELDLAIASLREAAKIDKTDESKNKLAKLLISHGEVDAGLSVLAQIPSQSSDARKIEKTMLSLMTGGEWEAAVDYFKKVPQHSEDWRLKYLQGVCLTQTGKKQEAFDLFISLKDASKKIIGVKPLLTDKHFAQVRTNTYPVYKGWSQLSQYVNVIQRENYVFANMRQYSRRSYRGYSAYGGTSLISLPGTPKEAAWLGVLKAAYVALQFGEEKRKAAWNQLSVIGVDEVPLFLLVYMNQRHGIRQANTQEDLQKEISKRLESDPDNPILLTYWMRGIKPESAPNKERLFEIIAIFEKHSPTAAAMISQQMLRLKVLKIEEFTASMLELYEKCEEEKKDEMLSYVISGLRQIAQNDESKEKLNAFYAKALERIYAKAEEPKNSWWVSTVLNDLLMRNKGEEAVRLINHLCMWETKRKPGQPGANMGGYQYTMQRFYSGLRSSSRYGRTGQYLVAPSKFPTELKGVHRSVLSLITSRMQQTLRTVVIDEEQKKLLKLLDEEPKTKKATSSASSRSPQNNQPLKSLQGFTDGIENTILRAMILAALKDDESLKVLVKKFETSTNANELLIAAGYYHDTPKGNEKSYRIMEKVAGLSNLKAATRKKVDGHLVFLGAELAGDENNQIDLEPAKRAALRLRKTIISQEKSKLITMMQNLGLSDEVERMVKSAKLLAPISRSRAYRRPARGQALSLVLIREDKTEDAVRESVREIRRLTQRGQNSSYELKRYIGFLKKHQLVDATVKKMDPGANGSFTRRLSYADFCRMLSKHDKALPMYEQLLKERPHSQQAFIGWMLSSPHEKIAERMLVPEENGKIDYEKLSALFSQMATEADNDVDITLNMFRSLSHFLEKLDPSISADVNLSWINYLMVARAMDTYFTEYRLASLIGEGSSGTLSEKNAKKSEERDQLAKRLFLSMLNHSQTSEQGFMLMRASKKRLKLSDDELIKYAQKAAVEVLRRPKGPMNYSGNNNLWTRYGSNGSSSSSGGLSGSISPIAYLAAEGLKKGGDLLGKELLTAMEKLQPEKFKRITLVRQLDKASGKDAMKLFKEWADSLPGEGANRNSEVYQLVDTIIFINPKNAAWTAELQKLLLDEQLIGYAGSSWSGVRVKWAKWIVASQGNEACEKYLEQLLILNLAPKKKWPILAKLGNNRLPTSYQQRIYSLDALLTAMLADPTVAGTAVRVILDNDITPVFSNIPYRMQRLWNVRHESPEKCLEWIRNNRLINKRPKGSPFNAARVFFVANSASQIRLKQSKMKAEVAKLLLADKKFDPILAQVVAARLLGGDKGREVISKTIAANPKDFAALMANSKIKTQTMIRYWFPSLTTTENSKGASKYLKTLRRDLIAEAKSKAAKWSKGFTFSQNHNSGSEYIPHVLLIIEDDPYEGAKLWGSMLRDVKKQSNVVANNPFSRSGSNAWHDSWNYRLFQGLFNTSGSTKLSPLHRIKFIHSLYSNEANNYLLEPSWSSNNYNYNLWSEFEKYAKTIKTSKGESYKRTGLAMEAWAKKLTKDEQATMVVLLQYGLTERMRINSSDSANYQKWVTERYAGKSTPVACAMRSFALIRVRGYKSTDSELRAAQRLEEQAAFAELMEHKGLSVPFRVELIHNTINRSSSSPLIKSEQIWKLIVKALIDYKKGNRSTANSVWYKILPKMINLKFDGRKNVAGELATEAENVLLNSLPASSNHRSIITRSILMLGLEGGNKKIIQRYLTAHVNDFRGNLKLMIELTRQGEAELAKRLVVPGGIKYTTSNLGVYDAEFKKVSDQLIASIPQKYKYRLEVLLANLIDPSDPKPTLSRADRLKALAARYQTEEPRVRQARLDVLAILASDPEASATVAQELRAEAARTTLAKILLTRGDSQGRIEGVMLKTIVNRVNQMDLKAGSYKGVEAHLKSLRKLAGTDESYQASYSSREILKVIAQHMLQRLAEHPEQAKLLLPLATEVIKNSTALAKHNSSLLRQGITVSMMVYCLANEADQLGVLIKSLSEPEQEIYQKFLKDHKLATRTRYLASKAWSAKANEAHRRRLLKALFASRWFCHEQIGHFTDLSSIGDAHFMSLDDVISGIDSLPEGHSRRAEFICEKAGIMAWRQNKIEEADKVYAQAIEVAKMQKDESVIHLVLAYRSWMLAEKGKLDRARKWGQMVNREMLDKFDLHRFDSGRKRWESTSKKK